MVVRQAFSHELFPTYHEAVSVMDRRPRMRLMVYGSRELTAKIAMV